MNCCKFPLLALEKTCPLGNGNLFGTHSKIRLRSNLFFSLERNTDKKNIILMSTRCLQSAALSSSVDELSQPLQQYLHFWLHPQCGTSRKHTPPVKGWFSARWVCWSGWGQEPGRVQRWEGGFGCCCERCEDLALFLLQKWVVWVRLINYFVSQRH